jgi:hypothetical protein
LAVAKKHHKPHFVFNGTNLDELYDWLNSFNRGIELNIAGPRESEAHGIYAKTSTLIQNLLQKPLLKV